MQRLFEGGYGIVLTPFNEKGNVDYNKLERQVETISSSPALKGLVVCGSTGEFTRLTFDENVQLMKVVTSVAKGKKPVICGATAGDSYTAGKYLEYITALDADGALIAPPYYYSLSDDEIYEYYQVIIKNNSAKIPILGYNIPQCTNSISVGVFEKLLEFDCFKGFKNSWNDMQEITTEISLRNKYRPDVSMLTGLDACLYGTLALGGDGIFSAITYLMPEIIDFIYQNYGKSEKSFECQSELIELIRVVGGFTFPYGYRVLSDAVGFNLGEGREAIPLLIKDMAYTAKKEMRDIYDKLKRNYIMSSGKPSSNF